MHLFLTLVLLVLGLAGVAAGTLWQVHLLALAEEQEEQDREQDYFEFLEDQFARDPEEAA